MLPITSTTLCDFLHQLSEVALCVTQLCPSPLLALPLGSLPGIWSPVRQQCLSLVCSGLKKILSPEELSWKYQESLPGTTLNIWGMGSSCINPNFLSLCWENSKAFPSFLLGPHRAWEQWPQWKPLIEATWNDFPLTPICFSSNSWHYHPNLFDP